MKTILVSLFCAVAALAQKPGMFEVTSVKANRSGALQGRGINIEGARIAGENLSPRVLIEQAYGVLDFQIDGGPKLHATDGTPARSMKAVNQKMIASGVNVGAPSYRIGIQPMFAGRTVVDKAGLTGFYDFTLKWEGGDDTESPLPRSLREQLGLKLSSEKGPVGVLVIDSAEQPSET